MATHDTGQAYTARLATFKRADKAASGHVSPVRLAQSGFYYKRRLRGVLCAECASRHQLEEFLSDSESVSPQLSEFHKPDCSFVHQDGCRTLTFAAPDVDLILYNDSLTPTPDVGEKSWDSASFSPTVSSGDVGHVFEQSLISKLEHLPEAFKEKCCCKGENSSLHNERKLRISSNTFQSSHEFNGEPIDCSSQADETQTCVKARHLESSHTGSEKSRDVTATSPPSHAAGIAQSNTLDSSQSKATAHPSALGLGKSTCTAQLGTQEPSEPTATAQLGTREPSLSTITPTHLTETEPNPVGSAVKAPENSDIRKSYACIFSLFFIYLHSLYAVYLLISRQLFYITSYTYC